MFLGDVFLDFLTWLLLLLEAEFSASCRGEAGSVNRFGGQKPGNLVNFIDIGLHRMVVMPKKVP